jgi:hypothetical protein
MSDELPGGMERLLILNICFFFKANNQILKSSPTYRKIKVGEWRLFVNFTKFSPT